MRSAHDTLVEKYLTGMMSPDEQAAFIERMKSDEPLRRLVEADAIITTGMRKEMMTMAAGAMEPSAELMARLAATPPAIGMSAAGNGGGIAAALFSRSTIKIFVGAIGVAGIAIGTFLVAPLMRHDEPATVAPPDAMGTIPPAKPVLPPATERTENGSQHSTSTPPESPGKSLPATPADNAHEPHPPAGAGSPASPAALQQDKSTVAPAEGRDLLEEQFSDAPAVFSSDTVKMNVKMRPGKK